MTEMTWWSSSARREFRTGVTRQPGPFSIHHERCRDVLKVMIKSRSWGAEGPGILSGGEGQKDTLQALTTPTLTACKSTYGQQVAVDDHVDTTSLSVKWKRVGVEPQNFRIRRDTNRDRV